VTEHYSSAVTAATFTRERCEVSSRPPLEGRGVALVCTERRLCRAGAAPLYGGVGRRGVGGEKKKIFQVSGKIEDSNATFCSRSPVETGSRPSHPRTRALP
jgi:hypothetical protein